MSKVPVIFLSSASDNMNIVMAVNMGGDDFIAKPFDLDVLTVKIQAMLRRIYDFTGQSTVMEHRGAFLNLSEATVVYGEEKAELTKNELKILQVLMENKEKVVSRDTLMTKLWEDDSFVDENTLSVNVNRLRRKLDGIGLSDFIMTKGNRLSNRIADSLRCGEGDRNMNFWNYIKHRIKWLVSVLFCGLVMVAVMIVNHIPNRRSYMAWIMPYPVGRDCSNRLLWMSEAI